MITNTAIYNYESITNYKHLESANLRQGSWSGKIAPIQ